MFLRFDYKYKHNKNFLKIKTINQISVGYYKAIFSSNPAAQFNPN